ncbi:interferon-stimulated 20 kDa exonuclease-like 2 [Eucyclogobius newberryi]|uniref:interferon-stimulated 20 kDa exonuclease-like 2 n=1 Tax=Eucyclogobius newberryi TaxID=166745 RepID=UPI003B5B2767
MSDNNLHPSKKHWKSKRKKKRNWNGPDSPLTYKTGFADKVTLNSRVGSDQSSSSTSSSSSQSSAPVRQVNTNTSAHILPASSAAAGPPKGPPKGPSKGPPKGHPGTSADSKRDFSSAMAGPSTQGSAQRTFSSFSAAGPTKCLAIDCEMVGAGPKGHISQLARCSIVSYNGDVVYDKFIRPALPVTDYRTRWSGIRKSDLYGAMPYEQARKEILKLLSGKLLIGHAVHNDLKVLSYSHPKTLLRDTSRIPLLNTKAGFPEKQPASLKRLTKAIFNRDIQTGRKGHSSVEDAKATMDLYKVVEVEWERKISTA